ncbi:unnamed protein product [Owenia fusiformis]|uniref:Alpha-amylase n=1 Tax=Owenia fusiformis TaxID=6347 RepID=A0A8J1TWX9_OWEFU|nr:unnamed protein product [Owenia fusiformis]
MVIINRYITKPPDQPPNSPNKMQGCTLLIVALLFGATLANKSPHCHNGRFGIVHLFEWRWADIAAECERWLGPKNFCGVQISPPNEHRIIDSPDYRPWYQRYQPVSYKLDSRSGNEQELRDMVERCNKAGVRIYADLVINHMTGGGQGQGSSGSYWNADSLSYPAVPFGSGDFNGRDVCNTGSGNIENYNDANQVRNCRLLGLRDLRLGKDYVRGKVADYINNLIDMGMAGFRVDAVKHMWPGDLQNIYSRLKNLNSRYFLSNSRPFIFQEVIDMGGEPIKGTDYTHLGQVTEFKYGKELGDVIRKNNGQRLRYLRNFGEGWGMLRSGDSLVFVDNHDNQRGHGAGGYGSILTHADSKMYKMANAFMMAFPYGTVRIMSSYSWQRNIQGGKDKNDWIGPPSNGGNTKSVPINADNTCGDGWVCEHRWRQIYNMVSFGAKSQNEPLRNWWDNGWQQVAFSRGNKAFIAFNNEDREMDVTLQTGLPAGTYCDIVSGQNGKGNCSGKTIYVGNDGRARIQISNRADDSFIAIMV